MSDQFAVAITEAACRTLVEKLEYPAMIYPIYCQEDAERAAFEMDIHFGCTPGAKRLDWLNISIKAVDFLVAHFGGVQINPVSEYRRYRFRVRNADIMRTFTFCLESGVPTAEALARAGTPYGLEGRQVRNVLMGGIGSPASELGLPDWVCRELGHAYHRFMVPARP